jgi:hypothetical protein
MASPYFTYFTVSLLIVTTFCDTFFIYIVTMNAFFCVCGNIQQHGPDRAAAGPVPDVLDTLPRSVAYLEAADDTRASEHV